MVVGSWSEFAPDGALLFGRSGFVVRRHEGAAVNVVAFEFGDEAVPLGGLARAVPWDVRCVVLSFEPCYGLLDCDSRVRDRLVGTCELLERKGMLHGISLSPNSLVGVEVFISDIEVGNAGGLRGIVGCGERVSVDIDVDGALKLAARVDDDGRVRLVLEFEFSLVGRG